MNVNTATPSGFPEFSPREEALHQQWLGVIRGVFARHGFMPITTPLVERTENLVQKGGNAKEIYSLVRLHAEDGDDHSGMSLRFDQTVPLALYVARHRNDLAFPFRRSVTGPVFRGERAQKGRFRQFTQCDIDIIGDGKLSHFADAEVMAVIIEVFETLKIGDFVVRINNREFLNAVFAHFGVAEDAFQSVLKVIDDLEKLPQNVLENKLTEQGIADPSGLISFLKEVPHDQFTPALTAAYQPLQDVLDALVAMGANPDYYRVDATIARGLDYYTGTVMETHLLGHEKLGSICSGGRYADLASAFTGASMPGVGISIGLTRLLSQIISEGILPLPAGNTAEVIIIPWSQNEILEAYALAKKVRKLGIGGKGFKTMVYTEDRKMKKKMAYANKIGVKFALVLGEDEVLDGTVTVKNLSTGEQNIIPQNEIHTAL